ncbi:GntR family transcriptional regulator [Heyndrickxia vini]|uniref:GntR family transcriptional regulator n=1 Tax=Heyndrickxia vini TaxID=1476025 RepID=A0ABX7E4I9_9BACI|nr:GntR family transcriptional regulator [Heyndrickxia vini]QQZ10124.1 GntR family transcriptional regulator [Heyndrickxia vini]
MNLSKKKGPIYLQVKNILKERILSGEYRIGTYIPSQEQLEHEFNVSKITIRNAVEELVGEGYLEKRSGKGTKVINNKLISKLSKAKNFTEILVDKGYKIQKKQANISVIHNEPDTFLYEQFGETCYCVTRLYYLDDQPYIYFSHYLPIWLSLSLDTEVYMMSLYDLLNEKGISFSRFTDEFEVESPSKEIAEKLQIPIQPLFKRMRYAYNEGDELVEYSIAFYNTNIHKYMVNFEV